LIGDSAVEELIDLIQGIWHLVINRYIVTDWIAIHN
jgi:hypothetical protein